MTEDKRIQILKSAKDEEEKNKDVLVFTTRDIVLKTVETKLEPHKDEIINYTDPSKTEPQNLSMANLRMYSNLLWKINQTLMETGAAQKYPEGVNPWPEITVLGTITRYVLDIYEKNKRPGENTHPFTGEAWNISDEEVRQYAEEVKKQIDKAKILLDSNGNIIPELPENQNEIEYLIRAICYLKLESFLDNQEKESNNEIAID